MPKTINYSIRSIIEVFKNFEFLNGSNMIANRAFHVHLEVFLDLENLHKQAKTFATNYKQHGYLIHSKVMRLFEDNVFDKLYELFIYSFVKCIHNGFFYNFLNEEADLGYAFEGHVQLFKLLTKMDNSDLKDDVRLSYSISKGGATWKAAFITKLVAQFKFLRNYRTYSNDDFGCHPFIIPEYEEYFSRFVDDYYSRDHVNTGRKDKGKEQDHKQDQGENDSVDEDNANKKKKKRKRNNMLNNQTYPNGRLHISNLRDKSVSQILSFSNSPVMNSFLSNDSKKLHFIAVGNGRKVDNNPSFSFTKANFLRLAKSGNDKLNIDRQYSEIVITNKQSHLICSEVFTITGIRCTTLVNEKLGGSLPSISSIVNSLKDLDFDMDKIMDALGETEEISDLLELLNQKLKKLVK